MKRIKSILLAALLTMAVCSSTALAGDIHGISRKGDIHGITRAGDIHGVFGSIMNIVGAVL